MTKLTTGVSTDTLPLLRTTRVFPIFSPMPASAIAYEHITFDADANPVFFRTGFKAMTIVREHVAYGWGAEELGLNHPQLTLGEVYSALAWYADHAAEVNARLDAELQRADDAHAKPMNRRLSELLKRSQQ